MSYTCLLPINSSSLNQFLQHQSLRDWVSKRVASCMHESKWQGPTRFATRLEEQQVVQTSCWLCSGEAVLCGNGSRQQTDAVSSEAAKRQERSPLHRRQGCPTRRTALAETVYNVGSGRAQQPSYQMAKAARAPTVKRKPQAPGPQTRLVKPKSKRARRILEAREPKLVR